MNGVLNQEMQPEAPVAEEAPEREGQPPVESEGDENTERVVLAAQKVLYDDQTHASIMNMLKADAEDPAKALANVASNLIIQLDDQAGGQIPEDAILPAAAEVVTLVAELAGAAKVFQADDDTQAQAMQQVLTTLGEHYGLDDEDMAEIQAVLAEQQGETQGAQE